MTTNVVETESTTAVVTENDITSVVEVTSAGPAGPPGGALTIQDQGVDEGLLTDKINFAGSTVSVVNDTEAEIATVTVNAADPGANTNITSLGGITGGISSPDYVQFDTAAAAAGAVGRLLWNDTDGTLEFQMKGGNVTLQIGQEQVIRVTNKAGVTMTDGQAVYITGSTGNHLNVTLAQANAEATSSKTLAVVTETIANNNTGFATSSGLVRGLDTSALTEGAAIWLSPTVPGGLTSTKPVAPNHAVLIGWCVRQHASVGVIYVHIANGYELDELHNVLITAAANNQVLRYDAATGLWKNATISPTLTLTGDVSGSATFTDLGNATLTATVADDSHNHIISNVDGLQDALDSKLLATDYNAADVLTKIKTVDGTGSGLDADLLDGQDGAHYLDFTNATNKPDPTITLAGDATGSVTLTDLTSGTLNVTVVDDSHNHVIANVDGLQDALDAKLPSASYTATDVLDKIKTVDGAGSGLDADLLDGQSSAYYTAINDRLGYTAENAANKGVAGGYASLDGAGLVPSTQLPSYVDDVLEFANLAAFPATGESGKIYVAVDTSKTYRWSGSTYVEISASPGSTDAVPEGSTNLYFTTARARQSISASGSLSYDNSTGVMSFTDAVTSVAGRTGDITLSTSDVSEGTNLYFTTARARSAISASGSLAYDSATGVVSYTTPNTDGIAEGTANLYHTTARARGAVSAGTGISYDSGTGVITNAAPDQTVSITGSGTTTVTGTYPNFTVSSADQYVGTVTSVSGTGTVNGLTLTGSVTSSGSLTLGGTLSVDLSTATVTGTLPVTKGGTGATSLTSGYLVKGNGTSAVSASVVYDNGTNVGIGTTVPSSKLEVYGSQTTPVTVTLRNDNAGTSAGTKLLFGNYAGTDTAYLSDQFDGGTFNVRLWKPTAGYMAFGIADAERVRIDGNGNLLVGTTALTYATAGRGVVGVNGSSSSLIEMQSGNSARGYIIADTGGVRVASAGATALQFETNGSERARIDASGNVLIGTTTAVDNNFPLELNAGASGLRGMGVNNNGGYGVYLTYDNTGRYSTNGAAIRNIANSPLYFETNNTLRATLDTSGNLGLGVTPSAWSGIFRTIQVGSLQGIAYLSGRNDGTNNAQFGLNAYYDGTNYIYASSSFASRYVQASGVHQWFTAPSGTAGNAISFTQAMTLDGSGNLGVGTTAPERKLDVQSAVSTTVRSRSTDTTSSYVGIVAAEHGSGSSLQLRAGNAYTVLMSTGASDPLLFSTNATERARITSAGNVGIGTSSPGTKLQINSQDGFRFDVEAGSASTMRFGSAFTGEATAALAFVRSAGSITFSNGATGSALVERMRIDSTGNVGIGTSSPGAKLRVLGTSGSPQFGAGTGGNAVFVNAFDSNPIYMTASVTDSTAFGFGAASNIPLFFMTNNTERARIDSSGNVGIGTTTPRAMLDVGTNASGSTTSTFHLGYSGLNFYGYRFANTITPSLEGGGTLSIQYGTSAAWVDAITVKDTGNVGIGTASPTAKLDVNADTVRVRTEKTPASATATGNAGDICWDSNYIYVCVATNTWKRSALSTW